MGAEIRTLLARWYAFRHGYKLRLVVDDARFYVCTDPYIRFFEFEAGNYIAYTVGSCIFVVSEKHLTAKTIKHELAHVTQWNKHGLFFDLWNYSRENRKKGYSFNRFETAARKAEEVSLKKKRKKRRKHNKKEPQ